MKIYIYALLDPEIFKIRYIGKTKSPKLRLQSHIDYARTCKTRRHVCDWIKSLLSQNLRPKLLIIEETTESLWVEREKFWIKYYRDRGYDLCNLTDGGESNTGWVYSEELREVRRKARIGYKTPEIVKEKIRSSLSKKVICIEDNVVFTSLKNAVKYSGIPKTSFHRKFHKKEQINNKTYKFY